jgi:hypothetical protein
MNCTLERRCQEITQPVCLTSLRFALRLLLAHLSTHWDDCEIGRNPRMWELGNALGIYHMNGTRDNDIKGTEEAFHPGRCFVEYDLIAFCMDYP